MPERSISHSVGTLRGGGGWGAGRGRSEQIHRASKGGWAAKQQACTWCPSTSGNNEERGTRQQARQQHGSSTSQPRQQRPALLASQPAAATATHSRQAGPRVQTICNERRSAGAAQVSTDADAAEPSRPSRLPYCPAASPAADATLLLALPQHRNVVQPQPVQPVGLLAHSRRSYYRPGSNLQQRGRSIFPRTARCRPSLRLTLVLFRGMVVLDRMASTPTLRRPWPSLILLQPSAGEGAGRRGSSGGQRQRLAGAVPAWAPAGRPRSCMRTIGPAGPPQTAGSAPGAPGESRPARCQQRCPLL